MTREKVKRTFQVYVPNTRKEKETVKPREEHVGEVVLGGRGNGMKAAPSSGFRVSVMAGDLPLLKHCIEDAASAGVMHLDEPPGT